MSATAHDMSRFWRIFTYQHGRINGTFIVFAGKDAVNNVKPHEVTVYVDDAHSWGRILVHDDFIAFVRDGAIDIPRHMIREAKRHDIEDVWDELVEAIEACVAAFPLQPGEAAGLVPAEITSDEELATERRDAARALRDLGREIEPGDPQPIVFDPPLTEAESDAYWDATTHTDGSE